MEKELEDIRTTVVSHRYGMGATVYFRCDPDQRAFMITGIMFSETSIQYRLGGHPTTAWAIESEITDTKDYKA